MGAKTALLVEAEQFDDLGGWTLDTEFVQTMGSPYLLAHGLGVPVADATTTIRLSAPGQWRVWVRTFDWVARWNASGCPGRFELLIDGAPLPTVFGTVGTDWHWQDGGVVEVTQAEVALALHDLTGFGARCDAVYFTPELDAGPPADDWARIPVSGSTVSYDLVVVGGGYAGMCAALGAARQGLHVALVQDRPVLGGNASSEIRVPLRGLVPESSPFPGMGALVKELEYDPAPSARYPNPADDRHCRSILEAEPSLDLFLGHCLVGVDTEDQQIRRVRALEARTGITRTFEAGLFADCTGHGTLGALAGADYQIGTEDGRSYRPNQNEALMGMTNMWFWEMDAQPQPFPETPWVLPFSVDDIPAWSLTNNSWCWESGFFRHATDDLEAIRDWNLRAVFGAWQAMKNAPDGRFANARLTFVSAIGGPRESRRLIGDHILTEDDMLGRREFDDGFVPVTWYLDRHFPVAESVRLFPDNPFLGKGQHKPGTAVEARPRHDAPWWGIPYRCLYSRNVGNLFLAGRNISTSYWAFGAVRVMRTCGMMGEVVGAAAAVCAEHACLPRSVHGRYLPELRHKLATSGR